MQTFKKNSKNMKEYLSSHQKYLEYLRNEYRDHRHNYFERVTGNLPISYSSTRSNRAGSLKEDY